MMHGPINDKSPNNISEWQMGFNSAFKGLTYKLSCIINVVNLLHVHSIRIKLADPITTQCKCVWRTKIKLHAF
jgi:hypothetical protein